MLKTEQIINYLNELFNEPICELQFKDNYQLLVAVILSAQCTDKRVNAVTEILFKKYPTVFDMAKAKNSDIEKLIFSCGFYHNKAKNIINASRAIVENFKGIVPSNREELESLPGVGRKTANVVLSTAFKQNAIAVDTHVFRVSHRLGLTSAKTPNLTEKDLSALFDEKFWSKLHYQMVLFGRYNCKARNPDCEGCGLKNICSFYASKH